MLSQKRSHFPCEEMLRLGVGFRSCLRFIAGKPCPRKPPAFCLKHKTCQPLTISTHNIMNLSVFPANRDFRQSSSSIFGNPESAEGGIFGTAMLVRASPPEAAGRVQQPPKMLETFADPEQSEGKISLEREKLSRVIYYC